MREPRFDEKHALSEKSSSKVKSSASVLGRLFVAIRNSRGMSLAEMVVTVAISSIVAMGVASLMSFAADQLFVVMEKNVTEENLLSGAYFLRFYLSQAVGIRGVTTPIGTAGPAGSVLAAVSGSYGFIRDDDLTSATVGYDSAASNGIVPGCAGCGAGGAPDGTVDLLAAFPRETGPNSVAGGAGTFTSQIRSTAIFFQRPNAGAVPVGNDQPWGRLYFDGGVANNLGYAGAAAELQPLLDRTIVNRLVRVQINVTEGPTDASGYEGARFAIVILTARYFRSTNQANWRWCDPGRMALNGAGCENTIANYRDIDLTVNIGFRDNILRPNSLTTPGVPDRLFGSLYFFKPTTPQVSF